MTLQSRHSVAQWFDYVNQAWVIDGLYSPCGHPATMRPNCCYAGVHAGEVADPSHFRA